MWVGGSGEIKNLRNYSTDFGLFKMSAGVFGEGSGIAVYSEGGCGSGRLTTGERVKESPAVFVFPWSSGPLAREIPDIFRHGWRRAGKFRNDGGGALLRLF